MAAKYHIITDLRCKIFHFGNEIGEASPNEDYSISLLKGRHLLSFVNIDNANDRCDIQYSVPENDIEDFIEVSLAPIRDKRLNEEKKERERIAYEQEQQRIKEQQRIAREKEEQRKREQREKERQQKLEQQRIEKEKEDSWRRFCIEHHIPYIDKKSLAAQSIAVANFRESIRKSSYRNNPSIQRANQRANKLNSCAKRYMEKNQVSYDVAYEHVCKLAESLMYQFIDKGYDVYAAREKSLESLDNQI